MQEVIEHYGKFILDAMVLLLLMMLIFLEIEDESGNKGILAIIGAQINNESVNYSLYTDFKETYKKESERTAPSISCEGVSLKVGEYKLSDYIKAEDYSGQSLAVKLVSITNPDGEDVMDIYRPDTTEIFFSQAGIYTIRVSARDDGNRVTEASFEILVNEK